ncbi:unnamed protein product [Symbiodinium sp. CCMP2592]|nr:unnamed protein product [Symbiodinium sp. CCMP2592]
MTSPEPKHVQAVDSDHGGFDFAEMSSPSKRSATDSDFSRNPSTEQLQLQEYEATSLAGSPAPRKERKLSGRTAQAAAKQNFLPGFATVESLEQWPTELLLRIFGKEQGDTGFRRRRRLEAALQHGLVLHTDFSGKGSVEQMLRMFDVERRVRLQDVWFRCFQANDIQKEALDALVDQSVESPEHVFKGLLETLPQSEQARIKSLRPEPRARKEQAEACHRAQLQYISASRKTLFAGSASNCIRHPGKCCPLYFPDPMGMDVQTPPLKVNFSGPMCSPFTSHGLQLGFADPSIESLNIWLAKMCESPMDLIFFENSDRFPWSLFVEAMSAETHWECHRCVFGAEELGLPVLRRRTYGVAINRKSLVWLGSEQPDVTEEFLSIFGRSPTLDGDAYAGLDSVESIQETRAELARRRGIYGSADEIALSALFTKAAQERFNKAASQYESRVKSGDTGAFIFDASQSENRSRINQLLPAATKTCVFVSLSKEHIFTQNEVDFSMGWPVLGTASCPQYAPVLPRSLSQQSHHMRRRLSGNGMCLQQVFAWFLFVQSHCARKQLLLHWVPPLLDECYYGCDLDKRQQKSGQKEDSAAPADQPAEPDALRRMQAAFSEAAEEKQGGHGDGEAVQNGPFD